MRERSNGPACHAKRPVGKVDLTRSVHSCSRAVAWRTPVTVSAVERPCLRLIDLQRRHDKLGSLRSNPRLRAGGWRQMERIGGQRGGGFQLGQHLERHSGAIN